MLNLYCNEKITALLQIVIDIQKKGNDMTFLNNIESGYR